MGGRRERRRMGQEGGRREEYGVPRRRNEGDGMGWIGVVEIWWMAEMEEEGTGREWRELEGGEGSGGGGVWWWSGSVMSVRFERARSPSKNYSNCTEYTLGMGMTQLVNYEEEEKPLSNTEYTLHNMQYTIRRAEYGGVHSKGTPYRILRTPYSVHFSKLKARLKTQDSGTHRRTRTRFASQQQLLCALNTSQSSSGRDVVKWRSLLGLAIGCKMVPYARPAVPWQLIN
jgi:hypothetical protein